MEKIDLLHVECSPRKTRSKSRMVAEEFISAYQKKNPKHKVRTLDLWNLELPEYDEFTANAKYKIISRETFSDGEIQRWDGIVKLFTAFSKADKYLFSIPMWNFSIPYRLKHYIDLITQPGLAFKAGHNGYEGLLTGRVAAMIYASGGSYADG